MRLPALTDLTPRQQEISDRITSRAGRHARAVPGLAAQLPNLPRRSRRSARTAASSPRSICGCGS